MGFALNLLVVVIKFRGHHCGEFELSECSSHPWAPCLPIKISVEKQSFAVVGLLAFLPTVLTFSVCAFLGIRCLGGRNVCWNGGFNVLWLLNLICGTCFQSLFSFWKALCFPGAICIDWVDLISLQSCSLLRLWTLLLNYTFIFLVSSPVVPAFPLFLVVSCCAAS